jgi:hypothetical protein
MIMAILVLSMMAWKKYAREKMHIPKSQKNPKTKMNPILRKTLERIIEFVNA